MKFSTPFSNMTEEIDVTYVVAAHNSEHVIQGTVAKLISSLEQRNLTFEIILVENASTDNTFQLAADLQDSDSRVKALQSEKGLGSAFKVGMLSSRGKLVIATADDLPFGMSDLDSYLNDPRPGSICIGSKGISGSKVERNLVRSIASTFFLIARFLILNLRVRDTQGTYLVDREIVYKVAPKLNEPGYIFTAEFAYVGHLLGFPIHELPVIAEPEVRGTTVRVIHDGIEMCRGLLRIRTSHRQKLIRDSR